MNLYKVHIITELSSDVIILVASSKEEAEQSAISENPDSSISCIATKIDIVNGFKISLEKIKENTIESPSLNNFKHKRLIINSPDFLAPTYSEYLKEPNLVKDWLFKYITDLHFVSCDNLITLYECIKQWVAWENDPLCRKAGFFKDIEINPNDLFTIREVLYETLGKCDGDDKITIKIE